MNELNEQLAMPLPTEPAPPDGAAMTAAMTAAIFGADGPAMTAGPVVANHPCGHQIVIRRFMGTPAGLRTVKRTIMELAAEPCADCRTDG